jgi:hypothetical protein
MTAPEPGRTVPPATANSPSTASTEPAIRRCQSVMAAQSGVTQRVRHGWVGGAHIAADPGSDVIVGLPSRRRPNGNMRWWLVAGARSACHWNRYMAGGVKEG